MSDESTVFIGNKPVMNYVLACLTSFSGAKEISLKARGRAISTAVDAAEILRNRFLPDVSVHNVEIGTETLAQQSGPNRNVSTIRIILKKEGNAGPVHKMTEEAATVKKSAKKSDDEE